MLTTVLTTDITEQFTYRLGNIFKYVLAIFACEHRKASKNSFLSSPIPTPSVHTVIMCSKMQKSCISDLGLFLLVIMKVLDTVYTLQSKLFQLL